MGFWKALFFPQKEQQIKIEGEFKPTVDCLCATHRRFVFIHKGMDATLAIKMRGWNRGMDSKKEVQQVYLVGTKSLGLTEGMKPLYFIQRYH